MEALAADSESESDACRDPQPAAGTSIPASQASESVAPPARALGTGRGARVARPSSLAAGGRRAARRGAGSVRCDGQAGAAAAGRPVFAVFTTHDRDGWLYTGTTRPLHEHSESRV